VQSERISNVECSITNSQVETGKETGVQGRRYDLEDRLIDFAVLIIDVVEALPPARAGNHIAGQLVRSGTSPAPNYGEAESAESRKDFIHKLKVCLKELRETRVWLKIIIRKSLISPPDLPKQALAECEELIRVFAKSVSTAGKATREAPKT
jgi:four helix bundle protein